MSNSNFYRNIVDIVYGSPAIIQYFTNNIICFTHNNTNIFTSVYVSSYTPDITGIDEKPNTIGYSYPQNNVETDISTWSIAPYIDSTTVTSFTQANLPTWCKNIRVVTIGGGGSGTPSSHRNSNHDHYINQNIRTDSGTGNHAQTQENNSGQHDGVVPNPPTQVHPSIHVQPGANHQGHGQLEQSFKNDGYHYNDHIHDNTNIASTGGGGGAGIYLTSIPTTYQIQIQTDESNKNTVLTLTGDIIYKITAGSGQGAVAGIVTNDNFQIGGNTISGPVQGNCYSGITGQSSAGQNGINNSGGLYSTTLPYGDGGLGATGATGYYRAYFLTN